MEVSYTQCVFFLSLSLSLSFPTSECLCYLINVTEYIRTSKNNSFVLPCLQIHYFSSFSAFQNDQNYSWYTSNTSFVFLCLKIFFGIFKIPSPLAVLAESTFFLMHTFSLLNVLWQILPHRYYVVVWSLTLFFASTLLRIKPPSVLRCASFPESHHLSWHLHPCSKHSQCHTH